MRSPSCSCGRDAQPAPAHACSSCQQPSAASAPCHPQGSVATARGRLSLASCDLEVTLLLTRPRDRERQPTHATVKPAGTVPTRFLCYFTVRSPSSARSAWPPPHLLHWSSLCQLKAALPAILLRNSAEKAASSVRELCACIVPSVVLFRSAACSCSDLHRFLSAQHPII